ncbi:putative amidase [Prunus yedoensis var. nudiflora]|uniref:Putative amidase n=1 Tax=Prunus yedoensis var. nudiflora TaxID=2094558 RepID=A0A314Y7Q0_PRUYE|nr:putative amidase [Prunus yedoensis var. nudiflora]
MAHPSLSHFSSFLLILLLFALPLGQQTAAGHGLSIKEATIDDLQLAFKHNKLTSRQLVQFYLGLISRLNPFLKGVIEVNPDALYLADKTDYERKTKAPSVSLSKLHGIPILVKDNIATKDKLNTTAGSYALLGSVVPRDAGVVTKLRKAGAIILGKASLSEWSYWRSGDAPSGWSGRGGQGVNPYNFKVTTSGSSSGSAISAAANLAAVTLGTETGVNFKSIQLELSGGHQTNNWPYKSSRVVPISPRQDTASHCLLWGVGLNRPIARTVSDAAYVLDVIAGIDSNDLATVRHRGTFPREAMHNFSDLMDLEIQTFEQHFNTLRKRGAVLVDNLEIAHFDEIYNASSEFIALTAEFKIYLNTYLKNLVASPVRSLADVIAFNNKNSKLVSK